MTGLPLTIAASMSIEALTTGGLQLTETQMSQLVDRLNLFVGVILLSFAVYLRFLAFQHVPRVYEYSYLLVGSSYVVSGLVHAADLAYYVTALRFLRQLAVVGLGSVFFWHLVRTTNLERPQTRLRKSYLHLRNTIHDWRSSSSDN